MSSFPWEGQPSSTLLQTRPHCYAMPGQPACPVLAPLPHPSHPPGTQQTLSPEEPGSWELMPYQHVTPLRGKNKVYVNTVSTFAERALVPHPQGVQQALGSHASVSSQG